MTRGQAITICPDSVQRSRQSTTKATDKINVLCGKSEYLNHALACLLAHLAAIVLNHPHQGFERAFKLAVSHVSLGQIDAQLQILR